MSALNIVIPNTKCNDLIDFAIENLIIIKLDI